MNMRGLLAIFALSIASLANAAPRQYVLVSAIGNEFNVVEARQTVGSKFPAYETRKIHGVAEAFNHMVLGALDKQVEQRDPGSRRTLMLHPGDGGKQAAPALRPRANLDAVIAQLKAHAERPHWDRIIVVTPAYRPKPDDELPAGLQGLGLFIQKNCESDETSCALGRTPTRGPTALLPDGSTANVNHFYAPYFFVTVWEVDSQSMQVIDKQEIFEFQRMVSEGYRGNSVFDSADSQAAAKKMGELVSRSIQVALRRTVGKVDVRVVDQPSL